MAAASDISSSVLELWPPVSPSDAVLTALAERLRARSVQPSASGSEHVPPVDDISAALAGVRPVRFAVAHIRDPAAGERVGGTAPPAATTDRHDPSAAVGGAGGDEPAAPPTASNAGAGASSDVAGAVGAAADTVGAGSASDSSDSDSDLSDVWEVEMNLWAYVWVTNTLLCEVLFSIGEHLGGAAVLELGAGSCVGAVGAALAAPTASVVATDIEAAGLDVGRESAKLNGLGEERLRFATLDWTEDSPAAAPADSFDLIIGADVLYFRDSCPHIAKLIRRCLKPGGVALITDPGRAVAETFVDVASREEGLHVRRHELPFLRTASAVIPKARIIEVSAAEFADVHLHAPLEAVLAAYRSPEAARLAVPDDVDSEAQRAALFTEDDAYFHP